MRFHSSFSDETEMGATQGSRGMERDVGYVAAVILGTFGIAVFVVGYMARAELWVLMQIPGVVAEFLVTGD